MSLKETYHILLTQELIFNDKFLMQMKKKISKDMCSIYHAQFKIYILHIYLYIIHKCSKNKLFDYYARNYKEYQIK